MATRVTVMPRATLSRGLAPEMVVPVPLGSAGLTVVIERDAWTDEAKRSALMFYLDVTVTGARRTDEYPVESYGGVVLDIFGNKRMDTISTSPLFFPNDATRVITARFLTREPLETAVHFDFLSLAELRVAAPQAGGMIDDMVADGRLR